MHAIIFVRLNVGMPFDRNKLRFGFEYETLIEPTEDYFELLEQLKKLSDERALSHVCNGILNRPEAGWENEKVDFTTLTKKEAEIVKALMAPAAISDDIFERFLVTSICNMGDVKGTRFKTLENIHSGVCDGFEILIDEHDNLVINTLATRKGSVSPKSERVWMVTVDMSVIKSKQRLYQKFLGKPIRFIKPKHALIEKTEIVSPILTFKDIYGSYFTSVMNVHLGAYDILRYWNNDNTSNHVHISYDDPLFHDHKPEFLIKFCMAWWYFEPIFLLLMGSWRRNNMFCTAMRENIYAKGALRQEYFMNLNDENFRDDKYLGFVWKNIANPSLQDIVNAIVLFFQGDITVRNTRYAALNLINLREGGIQTVEVRIKQGSNDAVENQMYMLLLADFIASVMERPCVSNLYQDDFKKLAWDVYNVLKPEWEDATKVRLPKAQKDMVDAVFREFITYIKNDYVIEHVIELYENACDMATTQKSATSSSGRGSTVTTPKKSIKGGTHEADAEYTSFGPVDYKEIRENAKKDSKYQQMLQNMKDRFARRSTSSRRSSLANKNTLKSNMVLAPTPIAAYGGGKKSQKQKK